MDLGISKRSQNQNQTSLIHMIGAYCMNVTGNNFSYLLAKNVARWSCKSCLFLFKTKCTLHDDSLKPKNYNHGFTYSPSIFHQLLANKCWNIQLYMKRWKISHSDVWGSCCCCSSTQHRQNVHSIYDFLPLMIRMRLNNFIENSCGFCIFISHIKIESSFQMQCNFTSSHTYMLNTI